MGGCAICGPMAAHERRFAVLNDSPIPWIVCARCAPRIVGIVVELTLDVDNADEFFDDAPRTPSTAA